MAMDREKELLIEIQRLKAEIKRLNRRRDREWAFVHPEIFEDHGS